MKWKPLLFSVVAVLGAVAATELVLFLVGVTPLAEREDPFLGFSAQVRVFETDDAAGVVRTRPRAVQHSFNYQEFPLDKPDGALRIFVLGGSSAYGFPWGAAQAFAAALETALAVSLPDREVQAINAAGMSYGSHRLRILTHELLDHAPDRLVVYGGHNEFVERDLHERLNAAEPLPGGLKLTLYRWRLYSALHRLIRPDAEPDASEEPGDAAALIGLDANREYSTDVAAADREVVRARFEENLRAVVAAATDAGVAVTLCTVPSNERGWRPNQTTWPGAMSATDRAAAQRAIERATEANDANDPEAALRALVDVETLTATAAGAWFEKGRAWLALERGDEAARAFAAARDLDGQPGRATTEINDTIRRVAETTGATLVDIDRVFREHAGGGIPGFDLFEDYVHPKPGAHLLIARELWREIVTDANDRAFLAALDLPEEFDFASASDAPEAEGSERSASLVFNLAVVLENQGRYDEAMQRYRRALEMNPAYIVARVNLARLLAITGDPRRAAEEYAQVLQVWPDHLASAIGLGEALRSLGMLRQAEAALRRATEIDATSAGAWNALGSVYTVARDHAEAERAYQRTVELDPDNLAVRANLGMAIFFQGRFDEAETEFGAMLEIRADDPGAMNGMGAIAVERDDLDAARDWFTRVLALDPDNALARQGLTEVEQRAGG